MLNWYLYSTIIPYILESNPRHSFNRPLPTRQTDSVMSDDGESDE